MNSLLSRYRNTRTKKLAALWYCCFLTLAGFTSNAALVSNSNLISNGTFDRPDIGGGFETLNDSGDAGPGFGWQIVSDNTPNVFATTGFLGVDVINDLWAGTGGTQNSDGFDQSLDIDGVSSISQAFGTAVGEPYLVSFFYSHHPGRSSSRGGVKVEGATTLLSDGLFHNTSNSVANMQWDLYSKEFIADSTSTTLTLFGNASNGGFGFVVDNVVVVPEPSPAIFFMLVAIFVTTRRHARV